MIKYIETHPSFFKDIISSTYLSIAVSLFARLHQLNLLPEEYRLKFLEKVERNAIDTPDADFLDSQKIRAILNDSEIARIMDSVRKELIPNLSECIDDWRDNFDSSEDPEEYFRPLKDALESFGDELSDDAEADMLIDKAITKIDDLIEYYLKKYNEEEQNYEDYRDGPDKLQSFEVRCIFDDVDE